MTERTFDWVPFHDERSRSFAIRTAVAVRQPRNVSWRIPSPLDQGREGACVGFGWTHELLTTPVAVSPKRVFGGNDGTKFALDLYHRAQELDPWEGEDYEGTSVLAGAKGLKELGFLSEYRWAFNTHDLALGVSYAGPAVLGIPWLDSMYDAPNGILVPGGSVVGGHCIIATAYRKAGIIFDEPAFGLLNSWGPYWGTNGFAWIRESHLAQLLNDDGEACIPTRRSFNYKAYPLVK